MQKQKQDKNESLRGFKKSNILKKNYRSGGISKISQPSQKKEARGAKKRSSKQDQDDPTH